MKIGFTYLDLWYFLDETDWVRSHLLFFDKILVDYGRISLLEKIISPFPNAPKLLKQKLHEIEFLEKKGLINIFDNSNFSILAEHLTDKSVTDNLKLYMERYQNISNINEEQELKRVYSKFMEDDRAGGQYGIRYKSAVLNKIENENEYIPVIKKFYANPINQVVKKENVLQLILKKFPVINENISVDRIINIKEDEDIKMRYYALKRLYYKCLKIKLNP